MRLASKLQIILLYFFNSTFNAQVFLPDSIVKLKEDTNKVIKINNYVVKLYNGNKLKTEFEYIQLLNNAIFLSKKIKYHKGLINSYNKCILFTRNYRNYKYCKLYLDTLESISISNKDSMNLFQAYKGRALYYITQGIYLQAAEYYFKSQKIAENLKDEKLVGSVYNGLGILYLYTKDTSKAIYYHLAALKKRTQLKDTLGISHSYLNVGESYLLGGVYDSAKYYYFKALNIQSIKNNVVGQAYSYEGLGQLYLKKKDYNTALTYFLRSKSLLSKSDDITQINRTNCSVANSYLKLNKIDSAEKYYSICLNQSLSTNDNVILQEVYNGLYTIAKQKNNYKDALANFELYSEISKILTNEENTKKITQLEGEYQIEQERKLQKLENEKLAEKHEAERQKQKLILYFITFVALGFIGFIIYLIKTLKNKSLANKIITEQKQLVDIKNLEIEEKQKEIIDSIKYAKRIQMALLPNTNKIKKGLKT